MKPELIVSIVALFVLLTAVGMALKSLFQKESSKEELSFDIIQNQEMVKDAHPRCFCGEIATEPMPVLERTRGIFDFLRRLYAAPPRYVRSVDNSKRPELCRIHAHVADAKMDEFIFLRIRGILSEANAKVATEAASFERESLIKYLNDSLTDREKKQLRKSEASIVGLRAVNGDASSSS